MIDFWTFFLNPLVSWKQFPSTKQILIFKNVAFEANNVPFINCTIFEFLALHPATKKFTSQKRLKKYYFFLHCSTTFYKARSARWKLRRKKRPQSGAQVHCFRKSWSNHHLDKTGKIFCIFFAKKISAELIKSVGTFGCNKFELEERCKLNTFVTF